MIDKRFNDLDHVVVLLGGFRNQGCDLVCAFFGAIVFKEVARRLLIAVLRQVGQQSTCVIQGLILIFGKEVRNARHRVMQVATTQVFRGDFLACRSLHNRGTGNKHVRGVLRHDDEVGERRPVDRTTRAGTQDDRNLRDDSRGFGGLSENSTVLCKRGDAFLDASAARIQKRNDWNSHGEGAIHEEKDLIAFHLAQCAAADREVLCINGDWATVQRTDTRDDGRTELAGFDIAAGVAVELAEGAFVKQVVQALAGGLTSASMLRLTCFFFCRFQDAVRAIVEVSAADGFVLFGLVDSLGARWGHASSLMLTKTSPALTVSPAQT